MWKTEPAPAGLTIFGIPDAAKHETEHSFKVPWVLGLIATRSTNLQMPGINDLVAHAAQRIRSGLVAYDALERLKKNRNDVQARGELSGHAGDLGYALLLKRYVADPRKADDATIAKAAGDTVPGVAPLFWAFRVMVALGFYFIVAFATVFIFTTRRDFSQRWLLRLMLLSLPLPWIAAEFGWFVAEYGRQPWAIDGVLPTFLASSSLSVGQVLFTLCGFVLFYSLLLIVDIGLMLKYIRLGPVESLALSPRKTQPTAVPAE
jgi:cytochrome bd ubiquinol oxidase subunit I